jgi:hypothetical protein
MGLKNWGLGLKRLVRVGLGAHVHTHLQQAGGQQLATQLIMMAATNGVHGNKRNKHPKLGLTTRTWILTEVSKLLT